MEDIRRLFHIAGKVRNVLLELRHSRYVELLRRLTGSVDKIQEFANESRKMGMAIARGWYSAADRCQDKAIRQLNDISFSISQVQKFKDGPQKNIPQLSILVEELKQLQDEFTDFEYNDDENTLSVVTDPITLDDIFLGPFKIQLELNKISGLYQSSPYCVIALEPNPAASDDSVTHPHISNQKLCEGEGCAAVRTSLEQGRLSDFFLLVRSILNTYSPDSPYVALHEWDGVICYDCGYTMSSEDTYYCERCGHEYCSNCSTYCRQCDESVCLGCSSQCSHCDEMVCSHCISECEKCEELFCQSCLEDGLCPNCKEEMENKNEEQKTQLVSIEQNTSQPQANATEVNVTS